MIRFQCRHCKWRLTAHEHMAGHAVRCPSCGQRDTVPSASIKASAPLAKPAPLLARPAAPVLRPTSVQAIGPWLPALGLLVTICAILVIVNVTPRPLSNQSLTIPTTPPAAPGVPPRDTESQKPKKPSVKIFCANPIRVPRGGSTLVELTIQREDWDGNVQVYLDGLTERADPFTDFGEVRLYWKGDIFIGMEGTCINVTGGNTKGYARLFAGRRLTRSEYQLPMKYIYHPPYDTKEAATSINVRVE
jgi:hypothetical protein